MSRIYRYELEVTDRQTLELPLTAKPLTVAPARNGHYHIDLWCQVPGLTPTAPHVFEIFGTGHPMKDPGRLAYIGTAVMADGYVWHVFIEALAVPR